MKTRFILYFVPITILVFFFIISTYCAVGAFMIPDTGVTKCYDSNGNQIVCPQAGEPFYGQDAHYGPGAMSFTNNGNGTVTDNNTGLMWEVKGAADGIPDSLNPNDADNTYAWADAQGAIDELNAMNYAGHSDWRLPTPDELGTILDLSKQAPEHAIDKIFFTNCQPGNYWTSATYAGDLTMAWVFNFQTASDDFLDKANNFFVRAVRGGQ